MTSRGTLDEKLRCKSSTRRRLDGCSPGSCQKEALDTCSSGHRWCPALGGQGLPRSPGSGPWAGGPNVAKEAGQAICAGPGREDTLPFWDRERSQGEEFGFVSQPHQWTGCRVWGVGGNKSGIQAETAVRQQALWVAAHRIQSLLDPGLRPY